MGFEGFEKGHFFLTGFLLVWLKEGGGGDF